MSAYDEPELKEPPVAGSETDTWIGSLERQRRTFIWKAGGLDAAGLRATTAASRITLGGLLKHLARVEDEYFQVRLLGVDPSPPFDSHGWDSDWNSAADDTPEELYALWHEAVVRSRANLAKALAEAGPDQLMKWTYSGGQTPSLRATLADVVEEYARHVGHADFIRESIDGLIGEDAPEPE